MAWAFQYGAGTGMPVVAWNLLSGDKHRKSSLVYLSSEPSSSCSYYKDFESDSQSKQEDK